MERERLYYNDNTILCPLQCQQTIRIRNNLCGNCGSKYQHIVSLKKLSLKVNFDTDQLSSEVFVELES